MGCLECVLKSLNFVDLTVAAAVCAGTAYSIWHLHNESPSWVYGPILAADALFAFSTLLSWFTLSCHLAACAWLINISIVIDLLVAVGAAIFGALLLTQFATVQEWLKEVELDPSGSISGYPIPPELYDHLTRWKTTIAVVFFVLAGLQLFRAIVSCIIKERLQRSRPVDKEDYQGDKYDFAAPDTSASNYKHWDLSTNAPETERMSVLDKLHAALAEEKRIDGIRAQAEAARPKPKPKMAFKSNTRRRDYAQESLLASEHSPRMGADGSPILKEAEPPWRRETPSVW